MTDSNYDGANPALYTSKNKIFTIEAEAQQVLDELWSEGLTPIALNIGKITKAIDEYTLHFYDSRIRTARIPLMAGHSFRDQVRTAVLARVTLMSGPLGKQFQKRVRRAGHS
jgi:hypothetical protein